jgi:hypothetical protein
MDMPLIDRNPTEHETRLFQLLLSFFSNGMGWETEKSGQTRIGWRQMERVVSYFYSGRMHEEDKHVFDVICPAWENAKTKVGISVKSKELKKTSEYFSDNPTDTRLYLELSNSPAKFWDELGRFGVTEAHFGDDNYAQTIGEKVVGLVERWHQDAFSEDKTLSAHRSRYIVISYSGWSESTQSRKCAIHSLGLSLPPANWVFSSKRCLRGTCPTSGETLWDWYGLSGGQLKFYPRAETAMFQSEIFELLNARTTPFIDLVAEQFGDLSQLLPHLSDAQRQLF